MPLIICPDCEHQCSPNAVTCTHCGRILGNPLADVPSYGASLGARLLIAASVLLGILGLWLEASTGRASFGTYIVAILFGIWARLAQANAHHRAVIDSLHRRHR